MFRIAFFISWIESHYFYLERLPGYPADCPGFGHNSCSGGGQRNQFGNDFQAAGLVWTQDLCLQDSDGDGYSNGDELGDLCCVRNSYEMITDIPPNAQYLFPEIATNAANANSFPDRASCIQQITQQLQNLNIDAGKYQAKLDWGAMPPLSQSCVCNTRINLSYILSEPRTVSGPSLIASSSVVVCGLDRVTDFKVSVAYANKAPDPGPASNEQNVTPSNENTAVDDLPCMIDLTQAQPFLEIENEYKPVIPLQPEVVFEQLSDVAYWLFPVASASLLILCALFTWIAPPLNWLRKRRFYFRRSWSIGHILFTFGLIGITLAASFLTFYHDDYRETLERWQLFWGRFAYCCLIVGTACSIKFIGVATLLRKSWERVIVDHILWSSFGVIGVIIHMSMAIDIRTWSILMEQSAYVYGFIAATIMIFAWLIAMLEGVVGYKIFRLSHWLMPVALAFTCTHLAMVDELRYKQLSGNTIGFILVLAWYALSWILRIVRSKMLSKAMDFQRIDDQHVEIALPEMKWKPAQYISLMVPSISFVAHPFSLVPSKDGGCSIIPQAVGPFTRELMKINAENPPRILVLGPYGNCPLYERRLLIVAGAGITPALSLVNESTQLLWVFRHKALHDHLKDRINLTKDFCEYYYTGTDTHPDDVHKGRPDISEFVSRHNTGEKTSIFVCGNTSIQNAVWNAAKGQSNLDVRVEYFNFFNLNFS